ncbi:MFS transporter [Erysipelotrichaceae bacterium OttesenSCG-928-M19]|nr:MFS transporter [Erysipelotrichaceae bacterium OttesenSCG-928-M19]
MKTETNTKTKLIILLIAIIFTSSILRSTIVIVGPISDIIINDLNISATDFGLITTIPLIVFALSSAIIPFIAGKNGLINTLIGGLILVMIGSILRAVDNYYVLLFGTIFLGFGISISNVLLPAIIKEYGQQRKAAYTSIYLCMQNIFASIASGIAFTIALAFSWNFLMLIWILPTVIALLLWFQYKKGHQTAKTQINAFSIDIVKQMLKSPYAWMISLIMGSQSVIYYTNTTWLPTIATNLGLSQSFISFLMISFQLAALPALFLIPLLLKKIKRNTDMLILSAAAIFSGIILILLANSAAPFYIGTLLLSLGTGGCFAWVVAIITENTKSSQHASSLSAMSQTIGYTMAAIGPVIGGLLVDITNSPQTIIYFLLAIASLIVIVTINCHLKRDKLIF